MKKRGVSLGIASSSSRDLIQASLSGNHVGEYFDCITTSCDVSKGKPAPDVYLKTAKELGVRPENCLVFEDVPMGIHAGLNAGMRVCAVEESFLRDAERGDPPPGGLLYKPPMIRCWITHMRYYEMNGRFLPVSRQDMEERGIRQLDFVYVTGDAYVDHPSFGHAVISRVLEAAGYTVGIIPQPDWRKKESVMVLGEREAGLPCDSGATWIPWSITMRYPEREDRRMLTHRGASWDAARITLWW